MKLTFLYAGQGSQKPGMGLDFYETFPQIRPIFENDSASLDLKELCFSAPAETLRQTRFTQPAMAAFAAAVTTLLYEYGVFPHYAAGLSLGEYNALYAAGVFDTDTLLRLLAFRGRVMEETTAHLDTKMYAILGLSAEKVEQAVAMAAPFGIVAAANYNCPGQIVIGGEGEAADKACGFCKELGAKRCLPLNVSGPFHTPLMAKAAALLTEKLRDFSFGAMRFPVICNATAAPLGRDDSIPAMLARQIQSPVLFEESILYLQKEGVDTVIEIGPGRVLSGFVKKTAPEITCYAIDTVGDFYDAVKGVKAGC